VTRGRVPALNVGRVYWRMLAPKWAHEPLSGQGAALHGGRYNARGEAALYMSEEFTTAIAEYEQDLGIRPGTLCAYEVEGARIADLGDARTLAALGLTENDLRAPWKQMAFIENKTPPTWLLQKRLLKEGVVGVRAPSVRSRGFNLILWRWNEADGPRARALDPLSDLPKDQRSWTGRSRSGQG